MEEQLAQAVEIASNPTAVQDATLPAQALNFLEHLKTITHESWAAGWAVFSARSHETSGNRPKYNEQARMFGLNLVADFLENNVSKASDPAGAVAYLQESALHFIREEYVSGSAERAAGYVKNKLAQVLTVLVIQTYSLPQPASLLPTLITLMRTHPSSIASSSSTLNPTTTDLALRVLHDLSVTLGSDVTLRAVRSKDRLQRDALIRDEIRASHAITIAEAVWSIVQDGLAKINAGNNNDGWGPETAALLTSMAISVVGDYVSWLDISLMVTPQTVSLFFALLQHRDVALRKASAGALVEVVSKGMKPASKLELLQVLNLTEVVGTLEAQTRTSGSSNDSDGQDQAVELRERLARLANGITLELVKILEDSATDASTRATADELLVRHLNLMLAFLADEFDEPTECVLSGTNASLSYYRKVKRKQPTSGGLSNAQLGVLARVVDVALSKMKYDDDAEWTGAGGTGDADGAASDEDEAHFLELRKQLQILLSAVASIDENIFATRVPHLIDQTLKAVDAGLSGNGPQVSWQQAEMAVFAAFFYVEVLINSSGLPKVGVSANTFVQMPLEAAKTPRNKLPISVYPTLPLTALGEAFQSVVQSNIATYPHPAVQLQFFECLNRYSTFFITRPNNLSVALFAFLDSRGLYNGHTGIRHRVWYLFSRFVKEVAGVIPHIYVEKVLDGMRDVLVVNAELPPCESDEDPLAKATESAGSFDSQLYLFESCGCLISLLKAESEEQTVLLRAVCDPLMGQLQQAVRNYSVNSNNLREVLQAHHLMLALANVAQGFPDLPHNALTAVDAGWVGVLKSVTEQILIALGALNRFSIIREASRGAFARIVATAGQAVLPFIPKLIQGLLGEITSAELVDFLSFLGLVVTKFKSNVQPMLDELLLLLIERIFHFLNQDVAGTDDAVQRSELQRAYISFVSTLVTNGLDGILVSERNSGQLQTILQSIVFYATNGDPTCQRASFNILGRLVILWAGDGKVGSQGAAAAASTNANGSTANGSVTAAPPPVRVPGFETFLYETLVPLTFEVPAKSDFDFNDAQAQMVLGEISTLLKTILGARGGELPRFLLEVFFPRIQCPQEMAREFVSNLEQTGPKGFKPFFQGFIKASRGG